MGYNAPGNVQYTYAQLEGIWNQAGGSPGAAPIAAAIAMAESGGNTTATNQDSNGTVDRGLWQINSVHGAQSTYDVMGNARAAVAISNNGQSWSPWATYTNGAYRQYLQTNVAADMSAPINGTNAAANATLTGAFGVPGVPSILDPTSWFSGAASDVTKAIIQGLIITILNPFIQIIAGIAGITAGGAMVVIGIFMMVKNTEAGQAAGKAAGQAAAAGMMAFGPEASAATEYASASGGVTRVTQSRRPAGKVKMGGQNIQYRPARVRTNVQRPTPDDTGTLLRNEANQYTNRKQPTQ